MFGGLADGEVRLSRPLWASGGELVVGGWTAWELVEGRHEPARWAEIIAAGDRFHDLVADVSRPAFIDRRSHQWAIADRAAWGSCRRAEYADALVWEGAPDDVVDAAAGVDELGQLLLRALIFRIVADRLIRRDQPVRPDDDDPFLRPVELACALAGA